MRTAALVLAAAVLTLPVGGGLAGAVWLAGRGVGSADAAATWNLVGVMALLAWPGFGRSVALSLFTGTAAAVLALILAALVVLGARGGAGSRGAFWLGPVLAMPHAAMAIGIAFLLAPSGWLVRLVSPWLTGWTSPPDLATVHDPGGLALILALVVKEAPFLIVVLLAAVGQIGAQEQLRVAAALGYAPSTAALKVLVPQLWPLVRLPFLAVLAYGIGNVDSALVLGPTAPPTLAVQALRWARDWDLERWRAAAAAGLATGLLVVAAFLLVVLAERVLARIARGPALAGGRETGAIALAVLGRSASVVLPVLAAAALGVLILWSVAAAWRFPEPLPVPGTSVWLAMAPRLGVPAMTTILLALGVAGASVGLALAAIAAAGSERRRSAVLALLVWLPLLVPQASFVIGAQAALVAFGLDGSVIAVGLFHVVQAFPYAVLLITGPWRRLDRRWEATAATLGAGALRRLVAVRLPLLLRPILMALAVAVAVSVDQYLTTLAAGGGRIATLATETLAQAAGGDRRVMAVHAIVQALPALLAFALALAVPHARERHRRGLAVAA